MGSILQVIFGSDSLLTLCVSLITVFAITLIFKTQTTTNFSQTTIATFGAYLVAKLSYENNIPAWASLLIGLAVCFLLGLLIDVGIIRRGRSVNAVGKQIITMGFTYVLLSIILVFLQIREMNGQIVQQNPATSFVDGGFDILGITYTYNTLICVVISVVVLAVLFVMIYKTKWGLGVRMTASNETVAQMMGVNTHVITAISWSIAAMLGCLAAVFLNNRIGKLSTAIMTATQISAFLGCIVGGFATFWGPVVATAILWFATAIVNVVGMIPEVSFVTKWQEVIVYVIAMFLVLLRPSGLFGKATRKKV